MINNVKMIKSLLAILEDDYAKEMEEHERDAVQIRKRRWDALKEIQENCPHNFEDVIDNSWEHPHNGDEVRDVSCATCGKTL